MNHHMPNLDCIENIGVSIVVFNRESNPSSWFEIFEVYKRQLQSSVNNQTAGKKNVIVNFGCLSNLKAVRKNV